MSLTAFVILITYLKKLNKFLKGLLITLAVHHFLSSLILIIEFAFMYYNQSQNFLACGILSQALLPSVNFSMDTLSLLSFLRYHLAWKTDNNELVWAYKVKALITLVMIAEHALNIAWNVLAFELGFAFWTSMCAKENFHRMPILPIYFCFKVAIVAGIGIFFDKKLMELLKKKNNSIGPSQNKLIKWKSSNEQPYTLTIPIRASLTLLGSIVLASSTVSLILIWIYDKNQDHEVYIISMHVGIVAMTFMWPALIGLTMKAAMDKKPPPVIPRRPMFHDEEDEDKKEEEIPGGNNEAKEEQIKPSTSKIIHVKPAAERFCDIENHV